MRRINIQTTCFLALLFALALAGCGKSKTSTPPNNQNTPVPQGQGTPDPTGSLPVYYGACNSPSKFQCFDLVGSFFSSATKAEFACSTLGSSFTLTLNASCPTTNRIGSCAYDGGLTQANTGRYYSGGPWTSTSAQQDCAAGSGGVYTPN